ncbi:MAG: molybdopterin-dependent oxidoreductase [Leptolyngbyaceae cyanobacterium MO_188.B28]|nr:molybdopterin-dependent oxidoreductase [Leptolyngbyaceae cyanobacterium MO_188.B28]
MPNSSTQTIRSACRMCHGVHQVLVQLEGDRVVKVCRDPDSLLGGICPKGAASPELLYHPDRLRYPLRRVGERGENRWERISWDDALDEMAARLSAIKQESGAEYFALTQGTGRPYTDFTNRFANAFGTPNFTGVAHNCMTPRALASLFTTGSLMPPMSDYYGFGGQTPACLMLWGCNVTEIGSVQGIGGDVVNRILGQVQQVIVIDPRRTATARRATQWLQIRPGTDGALALAMIHEIITENLIDHDFVQRHTTGFAELTAYIQPYTPEWAADITRIPAEQIRRAAGAYATTKPGAIQWGSAIDMSACSFQTARSLMILRAITGNLDKPGSDVFWMPPPGVKLKSLFMNLERAGRLFLPLGKVGRAVDSIHANQQTSWLRRLVFAGLDVLKDRFYTQIMERSARKPPAAQFMMFQKLKQGRYPLCPIVHPPTFWRSIVTGDPYRIRALWIMGSNPLLNTTNSREVETALKSLEYLVVSDLFLTPTAQLADLVLPASMWLEQDDVVNYMKQWCVLARRKVAQVGETRDDREVMIQLAHRLGLHKAFPWANYAEFLEEILAGTGLSFEQFCERGMLMGEMRYEKYKEQGFQTPDGKVQLICRELESLEVSPLPVYREPPLTPISAPDVAADYPLILTSGAKTVFFFHSEGRQIPSLRRRQPNPLVDIHPETASSLGIAEDDWVWIETPRDGQRPVGDHRVRMKVRFSEGLAKDVVSAQHCWWYPEAPPPEHGWKESSINLLFDAIECDPDIGSESLRSVLCRIYRAEPPAWAVDEASREVATQHIDHKEDL